MIHNVYVFSANGEPIITLKLGSIAAPEAMVSGFLSAIQTFAKKLTGAEVQQVNAGQFSILMRRVDDNFVAIASDQNDRDARLRLDEVARIVKEQTPYIPITPDEIIKSAVEAHEGGNVVLTKQSDFTHIASTRWDRG
jgi:hypothetical protein